MKSRALTRQPARRANSRKVCWRFSSSPGQRATRNKGGIALSALSFRSSACQLARRGGRRDYSRPAIGIVILNSITAYRKVKYFGALHLRYSDFIVQPFLPLCGYKDLR